MTNNDKIQVEIKVLNDTISVVNTCSTNLLCDVDSVDTLEIRKRLYEAKDLCLGKILELTKLLY